MTLEPHDLLTRQQVVAPHRAMNEHDLVCNRGRDLVDRCVRIDVGPGSPFHHLNEELHRSWGREVRTSFRRTIDARMGDATLA